MIFSDTEEDFYSNCVGGGDLNSGPDLDLIQQMLDMVSLFNCILHTVNNLHI